MDATRYKRIKITYLVQLEDFEISTSFFASGFLDADISGCLWGSDARITKAMDSIFGGQWNRIEETLSYGLNDDYANSLPVRAKRYFKIGVEGWLDCCEEGEASVTAQIIVESAS